MLNNNINRELTLEMARVTEIAAVASALHVGRGNEKQADQAAVDAMRRELNNLNISGEIVIGEGERDQAPMLYIGEKVGRGGAELDIALDPLEGTTLTAKGLPNALTVIALSEKNCLLNAPDVYMQKIAVGPGYPQDVIDLDADPIDNINSVAKAKGVKPNQINVCILDRERHATIIDKARSTGAATILIPDGDVLATLQCTNPQSKIDLYLGTGGAPEGVLAAAAMRCWGGQMQARLVLDSDKQQVRATKMGITDFNRKYLVTDLAQGDVVFSATGVTSGHLLQGVKKYPKQIFTETLLMRSRTGTIRWVKSCHQRLEKFKHFTE